jgi:predicted enzyme related to lactoylglutathione lyase
MTNQIGWFEVVGRDTDALKRFYGGLFDWKLEDLTEMPYTMVDPAGENGLRGGIGPDPSGGPGHVTFYVEVDRLEDSLSRVEELGGTKVAGPIDIPTGRIAHFTDPEGHVIGLLESSG